MAETTYILPGGRGHIKFVMSAVRERNERNGGFGIITLVNVGHNEDASEITITLSDALPENLVTSLGLQTLLME